MKNLLKCLVNKHVQMNKNPFSWLILSVIKCNKTLTNESFLNIAQHVFDTFNVNILDCSTMIQFNSLGIFSQYFGLPTLKPC